MNTTVVLSDSKFYEIHNAQTILRIMSVQSRSSTVLLWIKNCTIEYNDYKITEKSKAQKPMVDIVISHSNVTLLFTNCLFFENLFQDVIPLIKVQNELIMLFQWTIAYFQVISKLSTPVL